MLFGGAHEASAANSMADETNRDITLQLLIFLRAPDGGGRGM